MGSGKDVQSVSSRFYASIFYAYSLESGILDALDGPLRVTHRSELNKGTTLVLILIVANDLHFVDATELLEELLHLLLLPFPKQHIINHSSICKHTPRKLPCLLASPLSYQVFGICPTKSFKSTVFSCLLIKI